MITIEIVRRLFPNAPPENATAFAEQAQSLFAEFGISARPERLHFFLAQTGHESGLVLREENLNYSASRLRAVWPRRFPTEGATLGFAHNPRALANRVYGGRMGNDGPDDGWIYRGRGYLQITGKHGYSMVGRHAGLDLVAHPELALQLPHALRIACGFWDWKGLNAVCDTGDFAAVTRVINGGLTGLADRRAWLERVLRRVPGNLRLA
ncbi:glycoside hydrolase family 19 protein [Phreatobacter aquaticus]|uniref:glycoside hydrolase family 19 protein n=1 Tax=Phreatobacter aquaticus TaxID=2570229 RepID=UPI001AEF3AB1|nr:glycoside hydrolase family 19 protein [Phreatobacter aquaticus]